MVKKTIKTRIKTNTTKKEKISTSDTIGYLIITITILFGVGTLLFNQQITSFVDAIPQPILIIVGIIIILAVLSGLLKYPGGSDEDD